MTFHDLHHGDLPLLLPNAWDVASALAFVDAGYPAVGTTSFGVAVSHGSPDGGRASREPNRVLARALATLPVPLTMDIEDGYADEPDAVASYVAELGVAGVNIEDSLAERLVAPSVLAAKVAAVKQRMPEVFVNTRVDTYWLGQNATVDETVQRASTYIEAGADGVFVPGLSDDDTIRELASQIPKPLNVLAIPGRSLAQLAELGVRRVSTGSLPYRAAISAALQVAAQTPAGGSLPDAVPYHDLQQLLTSHRSPD